MRAGRSQAHRYRTCLMCMLLTPAAGQAAEELQPAVVEAARYSADVSIGSKVELPRRDIPNSVSVVTAQAIEDQNLTTVDAALATVTGITVVPNTDGQSQFRARGYPMALMNDGVPAYSSLSGYQQLDIAVYERIEVLRGPTGLLQGTADPGGSINLVSKRPTTHFRLNGSLTAGSWDSRRGVVDLGGALDQSGSLRARGVVAYQQRDSYVDFNRNDRRVGYGTLEWDPYAGTSLFASAAWQDDHTVAAYFGLPALSDGSFLDVPRSTTVAAPWSRSNWRISQYRAGGSRQMGRGWIAQLVWTDANQNLLFHDAVSQDAVRLSDSTLPFGRRHYDTDYRRRAVDLFVSGPFRLFGRTHSLVAGYNSDRYSSTSVGVERTTGAAIRLPFAQRALVPDFNLPAESGSQNESSQHGFYVQTRLKPLESVTLLAGTRLSEFNAYRRDVAPSVPRPRTSAGALSGEWVPYAGLIVGVRNNVSVYGSYASVFLPQSTQLRAGGTALPPRVGAQYEIGAKAEFLGGRIQASAAAFRLRDRNRALADAANPGFFTTAGLVKASGWESELSGNVGAGIDVTGGVSHTRSRYVRAQASRIGTVFDLFEPEDLWRLWGVKRITGPAGSWRLGLGVAGQSEMPDPVRRQGSYTLINALAGYETAHGVAVNLNLSNLLDKTYYARASTINAYNSYGPPRSIALTLRLTY
ncbi:MAG: TonB-dependent siderophore receptor [Steroidobacteraceae bacterium]